MATDPIDAFYQNYSEEAQHDFDTNSNFVAEIACFGTVELGHFLNGRVIHGLDMVAVAFCRHGIDILFSISALMRNSFVNNCKINLRALIENIFQLKYLLQDNQDQRTRSYIVWNIHQELKRIESIQEGNDRNRDLRRVLAADNRLNNLQLPNYEDVRQRHEELLDQLTGNDLSPYEMEFKRTRDEGNRNPNWFSLFNGPRTIQDLAIAIGEGGSYEILYRIFSGSVHGTMILKDSFSEFGRISPINSDRNLETMTQHSINWGLELLREFIQFFQPNRMQNFFSWRDREFNQ